MTLRISKDIQLSDKNDLPVTAALLTDHKLISLGLPAFSGMESVVLTDIYYGRKGVVDLLSSKNEWDLLFLSVGYQKMSDMKMVTKVISKKTTTAVIIFAPIFNQNEERIYKNEGAKAYIMERSDLNKNCESINPLIEEIYQRRIQSQINSSAKEKMPPEFISDSQIMALFEALSPCEKKVVKLYLKGLTVTEIANVNRRSVKTVSAQKQSAMKKLGILNSMEIFRCLGSYILT